MTFLAEYYDPSLRIKTSDTPASMALAERTRLSNMVAVVEIAATVPRRLGGDATSDDLARDKQTSKRVSHALTQCLNAWGGALPAANGAAINKKAAQLNWHKWWPEHKVWLNNRTVYVATWQQKTSTDLSWTKKAVSRLQNELRWIEYALR